MLHMLCIVEQLRPATNTSPFLQNEVMARPVLVAHPDSCTVPDKRNGKLSTTCTAWSEEASTLMDNGHVEEMN